MNLLESAPHIAIIGAGMAGLSCATALRDARCAVTVFERSQRPAGGMSIRQDGDWQCDHGAQYFTARDPWFRAEVARWIQAGAAAMWEPRLAVFDGTMHSVYPARTEKLERLVGTPSMTSPADLLASSLTVRTQSNIVELRRQASRWQLSTAGYGCLQERFDAIVLAVPAPEAAPLLHRAALVIKREQIAPDDIETVVTHVHQAAIDVLGTVTHPQTVHQAKFASQFAAKVTAVAQVQLPSATELWPTPTGTYTPQIARHHGRTLNRSRGRGYGPTLEVRERPVTRFYVGE